MIVWLPPELDPIFTPPHLTSETFSTYIVEAVLVYFTKHCDDIPGTKRQLGLSETERETERETETETVTVTEDRERERERDERNGEK